MSAEEPGISDAPAGHSDRPVRRGSFWNAAFPPAVLVVVAIIQIWRARALGQSPWKGGGFGMFATADSPGARSVRCRVRAGGGEFAAELPNDLLRAVSVAQVVPSERNLSYVAKRALAFRAVRKKKAFTTEMGATRNEAARSAAILLIDDETKIPEEYELVTFDAVTVEIWGTAFDSQTLTCTAYLEKSARAERGGR